MITSKELIKQIETSMFTPDTPEFGVFDSRLISRETDKAVMIESFDDELGKIKTKWIPKSVIIRHDIVVNTTNDTWPCIVVKGWFVKKNGWS